MTTATLTSKRRITAARRSITALKGMFGKPRKSVSIEEMNASIARRSAAAR